MLVVIESTVGGNVAGYLQCTVSGNETIGTLIDNFCESKVLYPSSVCGTPYDFFIYREFPLARTLCYEIRKGYCLKARKLSQLAR